MTWDKSISRLHFKDSADLSFGDGNDLIINHTGSHSFIQDAGSGNLNILSDSLYLQNTSGTEKYIVALNNAQVDLYHNNVTRLTTTGTGVEIVMILMLLVYQHSLVKQTLVLVEQSLLN